MEFLELISKIITTTDKKRNAFIVLWRDAYSPKDHDDWHEIEKEIYDTIIISLGVLTNENDIWIELTQNYGNEKEIYAVMNQIRIPKVAILARIPLSIEDMNELVYKHSVEIGD